MVSKNRNRPRKLWRCQEGAYPERGETRNTSEIKYFMLEMLKLLELSLCPQVKLALCPEEKEYGNVLTSTKDSQQPLLLYRRQ